MFEIREIKAGMDLMIGNWVDILEFAKRWESFTNLEKDLLLQLTKFSGTYSQIAEEIDFESRYANHENFEIKLALNHLIQLGLIDWEYKTCTYTVKPMSEVINRILEI